MSEHKPSYKVQEAVCRPMTQDCTVVQGTEKVCSIKDPNEHSGLQHPLMKKVSEALH